MPDKPVLRFCGKVPRRLGLSGWGEAFLLTPSLPDNPAPKEVAAPG